MKLLTLTLSLLTSLVVFANPPRPFIKESDIALVVRELNNLCGDTWCGGDYDINFKSMYCSFAGATTMECELKMTMTTTDFLKEKRQGQGYQATYEKTFSVGCTIEGLKKRTDLIDSDGRSVSENIINKVGDCIGDLESHLAKQK